LRDFTAISTADPPPEHFLRGIQRGAFKELCEWPDEPRRSVLFKKSVYMTNSTNEVGHMKVKSAELKTHLSHYLRLLQETGEEIEVCVRDKSVAYLSPAKEDPGSESRKVEIRKLEAAFQTVGITLSAPSLPNANQIPLPTPTLAGDGRSDVCTVEEMRNHRDW
jgi:antitoxin (DNA-binding transcriptional repressor) of toxin-antitoxin stability system